MARRTTPYECTNIHGQPLGRASELGLTVKQAAAHRRDTEAAASLDAADVEQVFDALALAGWQRGKTALVTLMRVWKLRRQNGLAFGGLEVGGALRRLHACGRAELHEGDGWSVPQAVAEARLRALLTARRPGTPDPLEAGVYARERSHRLQAGFRGLPIN